MVGDVGDRDKWWETWGTETSGGRRGGQRQVVGDVGDTDKWWETWGHRQVVGDVGDRDK